MPSLTASDDELLDARGAVEHRIFRMEREVDTRSAAHSANRIAGFRQVQSLTGAGTMGCSSQPERSFVTGSGTSTMPDRRPLQELLEVRRAGVLDAEREHAPAVRVDRSQGGLPLGDQLRQLGLLGPRRPVRPARAALRPRRPSTLRCAAAASATAPEIVVSTMSSSASADGNRTQTATGSMSLASPWTRGRSRIRLERDERRASACAARSPRALEVGLLGGDVLLGVRARASGRGDRGPRRGRAARRPGA